MKEAVKDVLVELTETYSWNGKTYGDGASIDEPKEVEIPGELYESLKAKAAAIATGKPQFLRVKVPAQILADEIGEEVYNAFTQALEQNDEVKARKILLGEPIEDESFGEDGEDCDGTIKQQPAKKATNRRKKA
jgi:hypothetical protein